MLFCMWAVETAVLGRACPARRACCSFCSTCAHMSCEVHTATCTYSACADSTQRGPRRGVCSQPRGSPWHRMARLVPFTKLTCFSAVSGAALRARNSVTHARTHARTKTAPGRRHWAMQPSMGPCASTSETRVSLYDACMRACVPRQGRLEGDRSDRELCQATPREARRGPIRPRALPSHAKGGSKGTDRIEGSAKATPREVRRGPIRPRALPKPRQGRFEGDRSDR